MLWTKTLKTAVQLLHSDISPNQIAGGAALGSIIGLSPHFSLQNLVIFFIILVLNVNIGAAFLAIGLFGLVGFLLDPVAHKVGYLLLVKADALTPLWTYLYNLPIVPFTRFYNTVVLGSLVIAVILFIPVFLLAKKLIVLYRTHWRSHVEQWKIMKLFKLTSIYNIYDKYK